MRTRGILPNDAPVDADLVHLQTLEPLTALTTVPEPAPFQAAEEVMALITRVTPPLPSLTHRRRRT